jgi:multidrug efflux pump subunit AcrA (membrane-fusion protein)
MKRWMWVVLLILVAGGAWYGYSVYQQQQEAQRAADEAAAAAADEQLEGVIWASGKLQPALWAALTPLGAGTVAVIHVAAGDQVKAGDVLLELDNVALASQVRVAEAALAEAESALAKTVAGATEADLAAGQAAVESAQAQVAVAAAQMLDVQSAIDLARAQVSTAQARYAEAASHPTAAEQLAARAAIAQAEAGLRNAEAAYNPVRGDPMIAARPESLALAQATANLEAANAQADVTAQGPTQQALAVFASEIAAAQTQVRAAENKGPGAEAAVKAALAQVNSAQAALDKLLAGATPEDIAMARARMQSAQAAVDSAKAQLSESLVVAPFAGQVGQVAVHVGEQIDPGEYALLVGDTSHMRVETTDLRETDVVRVHEGMTVEVTFDALPDRVFAGTVTHVAPVSSAEKGSTNYTVQVEVAELDPSLRWGMTAFVNIRPE